MAILKKPLIIFMCMSILTACASANNQTSSENSQSSEISSSSLPDSQSSQSSLTETSSSEVEISKEPQISSLPPQISEEEPDVIHPVPPQQSGPFEKPDMDKIFLEVDNIIKEHGYSMDIREKLSNPQQNEYDRRAEEDAEKLEVLLENNLSDKEYLSVGTLSFNKVTIYTGSYDKVKAIVDKHGDKNLIVEILDTPYTKEFANKFEQDIRNSPAGSCKVHFPNGDNSIMIYNFREVKALMTAIYGGCPEFEQWLEDYEHKDLVNYYVPDMATQKPNPA